MRVTVSVVLCLFLTACASSQEKDAYIGWHCSGKEGSENWRCEQKLMRNGRPVQTAESELIAAKDEQAVIDDKPVEEPLAVIQPTVDEITSPEQNASVDSESHSIPESPQILTELERKRTWREQLPDMDASPELLDEKDKPKLQSGKPAKPRELRRPEPAFKGSDGTATNASRHHSKPITQLELNTSPVSMPDSKHTMVMSEKGGAGSFTVQLAAFRDYSQLEDFADGLHLDSTKLDSYLTKSQEGIWHVLVWGRFKTRQEAEQQWQLQGQPELEAWVRSLSTLSSGLSQ